MSRLYRPETDTQRVQAMQAAKSKYNATDPTQRAYSADTHTRLDGFLPLYLTEIQERGTALSLQTEATAAINPQRRKLRLYISHFIIGLDNAILREELPASARAYYQLSVNGGAQPKLTTDEDLVQWANNIITGETNRTAAGGTALSNPTAAQVKDNLLLFEPLLADLTTRKSAYDKEQEDVNALRTEADDILADVWDEVLFYYRKDDAPSLRRKAREWGVVYRPSKDEEPSADEFSLKGTVTDTATGAPLADAEVLITELGQSTFTDADGRYIFGLQPAGSYTLKVVKAGYVTATASVTLTAGTLATVDVQMKAEA